ncbi:hypothetical protein [Edwardsiella anguillarum]|uniref:Prophage protein n=1 Tax=Edwardsiella anguillarum TaxID=1821960 RepID=A0ABY8SHY3_9GAMM|nr:hypothetical protein [Edwardsiella anguillarum]WHP85165.1 hypothetical protein MQ095_07020 [Edwardsiella anguillarum]WHP88948.1 hypothetical protein MQ088_07025 [Edwardsiella anguillarum]WHP92747.1 hypothetical protein MQ091_07020 [Edwardsiella anguillarum]WHP96552.1 hypothetical protein MQ096_07015 [Edwardsiella anguillarum]WHQ00423.1 hypothetical protein MQ082_07020 [Edwardsiella anguillarum]
MTTITKEQAQKIIDAADDVISALAGTNDDIHPESETMIHAYDYLNDVAAPPAVVRELARIALASLEAAKSDNPIHDLFLRAKALMYQSGGSPIENSLNPVDAWLFEAERSGLPVAPLYTAPPAPVVLDGLKRAVEFYEQVKHENTPTETGVWKDAVNWVIEEACRAAMLNSPSTSKGGVK